MKPSALAVAPAWNAHVHGHAIGAAWSPNGASLAVAALDGPVTLFDAGDGAPRATLPGHDFASTCLSWRFDGAVLATGGQDGKVRIWDPHTAALLRSLEAGSAWVECLAYATSKDWLVSAAGRHLRLWNTAGECLTAYPAHPSTISDVTWQHGEPFFTTAAYGQLAIFRPGVPEPFKRFEWKGSILRALWSPDNNYVATGNQDASVHFWYRKSGRDLEMSGYAAKVRELAWDSSSRYLATGGSTVVTVWDCGGKGPAGTKPIQLQGHSALPSALAYQRRGPLLASGCRHGRLSLWNPSKGEDPLFSAQLRAEITQLAWSPDDSLLAAASGDGEVRVYRVGR